MQERTDGWPSNDRDHDGYHIQEIMWRRLIQHVDRAGHNLGSRVWLRRTELRSPMQQIVLTVRQVRETSNVSDAPSGNAGAAAIATIKPP